ncbi:MAG: nucleotidyltransferase family protein [Dehalococcoidia bacterium]
METALVRFDLQRMVATHRSARAVATIALLDPLTNPHTGNHGGFVSVDPSGGITRFVEGGSEMDVVEYINAGVYLLEPALFRFIPEATFFDFGRDLFPKLLRKQIPIQSHPIEGYMLGIDTRERLEIARRLIQTKVIELQ